MSFFLFAIKWAFFTFLSYFLGKIFAKDISLDMLKKASKIALMNAMIDFYEIKDFRIEY